jgi:hypothetical protein
MGERLYLFDDFYSIMLEKFKFTEIDVFHDKKIVFSKTLSEHLCHAEYRRLICERKLLQIPAGESHRLSMRGLPVIEAATSRLLRSTHYIVHCVGDAIMPARYE